MRLWCSLQWFFGPDVYLGADVSLPHNKQLIMHLNFAFSSAVAMKLDFESPADRYTHTPKISQVDLIH